MTTGTNFLNEHIIEKARVHYAITDTGGISPNVVQAQAEVLYLIRARRWPMRSRSTNASKKSLRARR